MEAKEYLSVREAAEFLGLRVSYVYKLTSSKLIPHFSPTGRKILFRQDELRNWVESHRVATTAELEQRAQTAAIR